MCLTFDVFNIDFFNIVVFPPAPSFLPSESARPHRGDQRHPSVRSLERGARGIESSGRDANDWQSWSTRVGWKVVAF
jgi:hypothetical protein